MKILLILLLGSFYLGGDSHRLLSDGSGREFHRLMGVESSYDNNALSKVGAIGIAQITTNLLSHYNWKEGKQILPSELKNEYTNKLVSRWYLRYLEGFFSKYDKIDRKVLKYSAYNMGQYRTIYTNNGITNGVLVYRPYVKKIIGAVPYFMFHNKNKRIWKGKNIDLYLILPLAKKPLPVHRISDSLGL